MLRITTLVAVLSAVLMMTACTSSNGKADTRSSEPEGRGCGQCTQELEAIRGQLERLDGIGELVTLHTYADSPTNGAGVKVELRSTGTGDTGIQDEVAEVIWKSRVTPLDELFVTVEDADGELVPTLPYDFTEHSRQHDTYVEQWGPRPVEE